MSQRSTKVLVPLGVAAIAFTAILAGRMVWEETFLTFQQGPQMLGFSLAHGPGALLFLAPILLLAWITAAIVVLVIGIVRKQSLSLAYWLTLGGAVAVMGVLSIPPVFFQWLLIDTFARSPYAADLMISGAAEGDLRTVRGYLDHGVPLTATNHEGSTALFMAAAGGSLPLVQLLADRGADLNATNLYGDSPLTVAIERGNIDVVSFLNAHGGKEIHGTPEQRDAASELIVHRDIERSQSR
jgi:hypothetical protein